MADINYLIGCIHRLLTDITSVFFRGGATSIKVKFYFDYDNSKINVYID